jgi:hypothetical protein
MKLGYLEEMVDYRAGTGKYKVNLKNLMSKSSRFKETLSTELA